MKVEILSPKPHFWPAYLGRHDFRDITVLRVGEATSIYIAGNEIRLSKADRERLVAELLKEPIAP